MRHRPRGLRRRQGRGHSRAVRDEAGRADAGSLITPFVCLIELQLHWNESGSLKGKRKEVSSLKALLRQRFGASVAEIEGHDSWQRSTVLCALVGDRTVEARADDLARFAESRCPEGCSVRIDVRSLRDIRG